MKINPHQFAFLLKSSSLNSDEQRAVLAQLPKMGEAQIKALYRRLKADHYAMAEVLQSAHVKRQQISDTLVTDSKSA